MLPASAQNKSMYTHILAEVVSLRFLFRMRGNACLKHIRFKSNKFSLDRNVYLLYIYGTHLYI